eukprot:7600144-Pyramimonas_sp.AAC.1
MPGALGSAFFRDVPERREGLIHGQVNVHDSRKIRRLGLSGGPNLRETAEGEPRSWRHLRGNQGLRTNNLQHKTICSAGACQTAQLPAGETTTARRAWSPQSALPPSAAPLPHTATSSLPGSTQAASE